MSYHYDYRNGRVTLNWLTPTGLAGKLYRLMSRVGLHWAVGLVRVHDDENEIPGDYNCIVIAFVIGKRCEIIGMCGQNPRPDEYRNFYAYLYSTGIKKIFHRRVKKGRGMYKIAQKIG